MSKKIECLPNFLEVLHTSEENSEHDQATVTLRVVREGEKFDLDMTPNAARELATELNAGADDAEEA